MEFKRNILIENQLKVVRKAIGENNTIVLKTRNLQSLANTYKDDSELQFYCFLQQTSMQQNDCIRNYESGNNTYWCAFWAYVAYLKQKQLSKAENVLDKLYSFVSMFKI